MNWSRHSKRSSAFPPLPSPLPARLVAQLPLPKSRPNSPLFWLLPVTRRLKSSRSSVQSPVWASRKPRTWLMALRSRSRKAFPRLMRKRSRSSWKTRAPRSKSSNRLLVCGLAAKSPALLCFVRQVLRLILSSRSYHDLLLHREETHPQEFRQARQRARRPLLVGDPTAVVQGFPARRGGSREAEK